MDRFSASSSRRRNPFTPREPAEETHDERPATGAGRTGDLLGAAPSDRNFRFADGPDNLGRRERGPAPMAGALTGDGGIEKLRALTDLLRSEYLGRLPRATPLAPVPGLRPAPAAKASPDRLAIQRDERWPTILPRQRRSFLERMGLPLGGALIIALCAGIVATGWLPAMDVSDAPRRPPDEAQRVALASLPQSGLTSTRFEGRAIAAGDERRMTVHAGDKLTGSEAEGAFPQTLSARERSAATAAASTVPASLHQGWQETRPTALLDVRNAKPVTEVEGQPLAGSTCYPSALAVTQDHPDTWPAWTLRAPGHEGMRCWHAATRAAVHDRRTEALRKKPRAGTPDDPGSPARSANSFARSPDFPPATTIGAPRF
jgi:hypothetical protein